MEGEGQKGKKKRVKKSSGGGPGGEKHWNELFTLPEREGLVGEADCTAQER